MDTEHLKSDLERIVGQCPLEEGETIAQIVTRLDARAQSSLTSERLKHYLVKRSYVKALAWLKDSSTPHHQ